MKGKNIHKSIQYNHDKEKLTNIEFDIVYENGKKIAKNIALKSNWRVYYPNNPEINSNSQGEYGFIANNVFSTNGDIQQMIKRILQCIEEYKG